MALEERQLTLPLRKLFLKKSLKELSGISINLTSTPNKIQHSLKKENIQEALLNLLFQLPLMGLTDPNNIRLIGERGKEEDRIKRLVLGWKFLKPY